MARKDAPLILELSSASGKDVGGHAKRVYQSLEPRQAGQQISVTRALSSCRFLQLGQKSVRLLSYAS